MTICKGSLSWKKAAILKTLACPSSKPRRLRKTLHFSPFPATVRSMQMIVVIPVALVREIVLSRATLQLENIALRQQAAVLKRERPRSWLRPFDRMFWVFLSRLRPRWKDALVIVKPETVIGWQWAGMLVFCGLRGFEERHRPSGLNLLRR